MATGYRVFVDDDGEIEVGDEIAFTTSTYTIDTFLGNGMVTWSGSGGTVGFYLGTDGNVYTDASTVIFPAPTSNGSVVSYSGSQPPCFCEGTRIGTPEGERRVDRLSVGDLVTTADHGAQPLRWIGCRIVDFRVQPDQHKPIMIAAGAFGPGRPGRDLAVSPQHRFLLAADAVDSPKGVLVPARALASLPKVRTMRGKRRVKYFSLLFDRHEIVFAEGVAAESFLPGRTVLDSMGAGERRGIDRVLSQRGVLPKYPPSRPLMRYQETVDRLSAGTLSPTAADRRVSSQG